MLLLSCEEPPTLSLVGDQHAIARLGEGVDRTKQISQAALDRCDAILSDHLAIATKHRVDRIVAFGTSALRDATNRQEIIDHIKEKHQIEIELLSGEDESQWTFRGAILGLHPHGAVGSLDIGGGSTELSLGDPEQFKEGKSLNIGAVRITERFFHHQPPTEKEIESARVFIQQELHSLPSSLYAITDLVAVAGTPTSLAAMDQQLTQFDVQRVQGYALTLDAAERSFHDMCTYTPDELCTNHPSLNRARADILAGGTLILIEVMRLLGLPSITVSTRGLRYGIALREFERMFGARTDWMIVSE